MPTVQVWPKPGNTVKKEDGFLTFTPAEVVERTSYVQRRLDQGDLYDFDPTGVPYLPFIDEQSVVQGRVATELDSLRGRYDGATTLTTGRNSEADGLGANFTWDDTSIVARNGTTIWGTGAVGRWIQTGTAGGGGSGSSFTGPSIAFAASGTASTTGIADAAYFAIVPGTAGLTVRALTRPTSGANINVRHAFNNSVHTLIVPHEDTTGTTAADRFATDDGQPVLWPGKTWMTFAYDSTLTRYRVRAWEDALTTGELWSALITRRGRREGEERAISGVAAVNKGVGRAVWVVGTSPGAITGVVGPTLGGGYWKRVTSELDFEMFGAVGDGSTDDTVPVKACVAFAVAEKLPIYSGAKTYLCEVALANWANDELGHAIRISGATYFEWYGLGTRIRLSDATLPDGRTANLKLVGCSNVRIVDVEFDGNRDGRDVEGLTGDSGDVGTDGDGGSSAVDILGGTDIYLRIASTDSCMEGISIAPITPGTYSTYPKRITLDNCVVRRAYRNGLGLIAGYEITVIGGSYSDTQGTLPEAGIDCEPNAGDTSGLDKVKFIGVRVDNNNGAGLVITGSQPEIKSTTGTGNGTLTELSVTGPAKIGDYTLACTATAAHGGTFRLTDPDGVQYSGLVCKPGAGVATTFDVAGFRFIITDGSTDFGTDKAWTFAGGRTQSRNIEISNLSGRNNKGGLFDFGACRDIVGSGISINDDTCVLTAPGFINMGRAAHGIVLDKLDFSGISGCAATKMLIYADNEGTGNALSRITARNICCRLALSPQHGLRLSQVVAENFYGTEEVIGFSGHYQVLQDYTATRCARSPLRCDVGTGVVVERVTINEPPTGAQAIYLAAGSGHTLRGIRIFASGDDPNVANGAVYGVYVADGVVPLEISDYEAKAAGTDYTNASKLRLPASVRRNSATAEVTVELPDVSTASDTFVTSPCSGRVVDVIAVLHSAVTVADSAITTAIQPAAGGGFTAITSGGFTIGQAASAAGKSYSAAPSGTHLVAKGDSLRVSTDGGSTGTAKLTVTFVIEKL